MMTEHYYKWCDLSKFFCPAWLRPAVIFFSKSSKSSNMFGFASQHQVEEHSNNPNAADAMLLFFWTTSLACLRQLIKVCCFLEAQFLWKVSVMNLLFFILTLLGPPSPLQINIKKLLIKNPAPRPPLKQDKQIWGCVCSLLAHPMRSFNDFTSTSGKKMQHGSMQPNMTKKDEDKT